MAREGKKSLPRRILKGILTIIIVLVVIVVAFVAVLTFTEYHPEPQEPAVAVEAEGQEITTRAAMPGKQITLTAWNIGYGALGDNADFLLDGGVHMLTSSGERVSQNMNAIINELRALDPDIMLIQEADRDSDRSAHLDQPAQIAAEFPSMQAYYATNYRTLYVPIGMPPYGKIEGGLTTLSTFAVQDATREALPESYSWPMSTVQLKRCQLVTRIPVVGSDKELVVINEHIDAYTDEEHQAAQVAMVRELLDAEAAKGNYVIAGGDWNHSFSSTDLTDYPILSTEKWTPGYLDVEEFGEGWQFLQDTSAPSCRLLDHPLVDDKGAPLDEPVQYFIIDGFVVSSNVRVDSLETQDLGFTNADHNPVLLKVTLL